MKNKIKWITVLLLTILFIVLTFLILNDKVSIFDMNVYNIVSFFKNDIITNIYKVITFFGSTIFMVLFCLFLLVYYIVKKSNKGWIIAVVLVISTVINNVLKLIIRRGRPLELMMVKESSFSFPSGHMMASVTMYGIIVFLIINSNLSKQKKIVYSILLGILTLLIGLSRIYLGAHYATDIIGALILSSIILLVYTTIIKNKELI